MINHFRTKLKLADHWDNSYSLTIDRVYRHITTVNAGIVGDIAIFNSFELRVFEDCNDASLVVALQEMIKYIEEYSIEIKSGAF